MHFTLVICGAPEYNHFHCLSLQSYAASYVAMQSSVGPPSLKLPTLVLIDPTQVVPLLLGPLGPTDGPLEPGPLLETDGPEELEIDVLLTLVLTLVLTLRWQLQHLFGTVTVMGIVMSSATAAP